MKIFRQGDVLMRSARIPKDAVLKEVTGRAVMAYGEVTGHAHALESVHDIELYEKDGRTFVRVINNEGTPLTHEEHGSIMLPRGDYERVIQREYSPEEIRSVQD